MEKSPFRFIWKYIRRFRWYLLAMMFFVTISTVAGRIYPYYFARIFDVVSTNTAAREILSPLLNLTFIALFWGLIKIFSFEIANYVSSRMLPRSRTVIYRDVFDYVNRQSINFFNQEMSGRVASKVEQLSSGVQSILDIIFRLFMVLLMMTVTFAIISSLSRWFFIPLALWLVIMAFLGKIFGLRLSELSRMSSGCESRAVGVITDSLSNYSEVKNFANSRYEHLNLMKYLKRLRQSELKESARHAGYHFLQQLIAGSSIFLFLMLSIFILIRGEIDAVQFIYANTLFTSMSGTIFDISWTYILLSRYFGKVRSALETLAVDPEIIDRPSARSVELTEAEIRFENVSFGYKANRKIFDGLNVRIRAGEKIGLVGLSGAGKSTFVKLLARYFDVSSGAITINGTDIRDITQDSLHRNIAAIPQDVCLFNRTLLENIRYGRVTASPEEVYAAAKRASADAFIRGFPEGYNTVVGERGVVLSGGERQRIAIARAILKNAPILIFDEATSALDSRSEKEIQQSLKELMIGKTVIAIAHRLSTLREMDRILVFDKGTIVEEGSHLSLLRQKGLYSRFYQMQADGFVSVDLPDSSR